MWGGLQARGRVSTCPLWPPPHVTAVAPGRAQCLSMVGAHYTFAQGMNLSVSTPYPQQVPSFPEAGTISLETPLMTRGRLLGLSVSKFACLKKKKNHISVFSMRAVSVLSSVPQQVGPLT